jgi:hypothetical protein
MSMPPTTPCGRVVSANESIREKLKQKLFELLEKARFYYPRGSQYYPVQHQLK